jgi:hypothetical protein
LFLQLLVESVIFLPLIPNPFLEGEESRLGKKARVMVRKKDGRLFFVNPNGNFDIEIIIPP